MALLPPELALVLADVAAAIASGLRVVGVHAGDHRAAEPFDLVGGPLE